MKYLITITFTLFFTSFTFAQTSLLGKITDKESSEDLIGANVVVEQNGIFKAGTITDFNGIYEVDIDPGIYDVIVTMIGYPESRINSVIVKPGLENKLDVQLDPGLIPICYFGPIYYHPPLIEIDNTTSGLIQTSEAIQRNPSRNTTDLIMNTAGVSSASY